MAKSVMTPVLLCLVVALTPAGAFAQRATTGTVTGKITDGTGAALPGVAVSLQSPEVLGVFSAVTD